MQTNRPKEMPRPPTLESSTALERISSAQEKNGYNIDDDYENPTEGGSLLYIGDRIPSDQTMPLSMDGLGSSPEIDFAFRSNESKSFNYPAPYITNVSVIRP